MQNNKIKNKGTAKRSRNVVERKNMAQTRLPVYMSKETKDDLQDLRISIYLYGGKWVSLTQIVRDAIEEQLKHEDDLIQKYME